MPASVAPCNAADNLQKWQFVPDGDGFVLRNAITQLAMSADGRGGVSQQAPEIRAAGRFTVRK